MMNTWSLRKRIGFGFGVLCLSLLLLGGFAVLRLRIIGTHAKEVSTLYTQQGALAANMLTTASNLAISARGYDVAPTEAQWVKVEEENTRTKAAVAAAEAFSAQHPELIELQQGLRTARPIFDAYQTALREFHDATTGFEQVWAELVPAGGRLFDTLNQLAVELDQTGAAGSSATADIAALKLLFEVFRDVADLRLACWRATGTQTSEPATLANQKAIAATQKLARLEAIAIPGIADHLREALVALESYEKGTLKLKDAMDRKLSSRANRAARYANFAAAAAAIQQSSTSLVDAGADATAARVESLTLLLVFGSAIAVGGGLGIAFLITRQTNRVLSGVSQTLAENAALTATAANQVSGASETLARGASEQAASLEETSASLEELSSMTKRNTESAQEAKSLSDQTRAAAERGAQDMREMESAMGAIKASSDGISKIIKTIDEIAFQTNILALNAAVEAARAGEAGMGFAVVADEVRSLAQRSAVSSRETAEKIEEAIQNSEQGVRISHSVAQSLGDIVEKARRVDRLVGEIVVASSEQNQGIGQVNVAIRQMDLVTQSNASGAEETSSAAQELKAQALTTQQTVAELTRLVQGGRPVGHRQPAIAFSSTSTVTAPTRRDASQPATRPQRESVTVAG